MVAAAAPGNPRLAGYKAVGGAVPITRRGTRIGDLVPALAAPDTPTLERLAAWRNEHREAFFSQGLVTPESTRAWLAGIAERPDRILFLIATDFGETVGHIGLTGVDEAQGRAESDAWLGAGHSRAPGIMLFGFAQMLDWAFAALRIECVRARVWSDNAPVLRAHRMLGFEVTGEAPLDAATQPRAVTHLQLARSRFGPGTQGWR